MEIKLLANNYVQNVFTFLMPTHPNSVFFKDIPHTLGLNAYFCSSILLSLSALSFLSLLLLAFQDDIEVLLYHATSD